MNDFNELNLSSGLMRALESMKYTKPTPIQAQAIPVGLTGRDLGEILVAWMPGLLVVVMAEDETGIQPDRFFRRPFKNNDLLRLSRFLAAIHFVVQPAA